MITWAAAAEAEGESATAPDDSSVDSWIWAPSAKSVPRKRYDCLSFLQTGFMQASPWGAIARPPKDAIGEGTDRLWLTVCLLTDSGRAPPADHRAIKCDFALWLFKDVRVWQWAAVHAS